MAELVVWQFTNTQQKLRVSFQLWFSRYVYTFLRPTGAVVRNVIKLELNSKYSISKTYQRGCEVTGYQRLITIIDITILCVQNVRCYCYTPRANRSLCTSVRPELNLHNIYNLIKYNR